MEQYWMPKHLDFKNLRKCINTYQANELFIRDCGGYRSNGKYSMHGLSKVNQNLKNKKLDFRKDKSGLCLLINKKEVFHFTLKNHYKGFSLAYERLKESFPIILQTGLNPNNPALPEPNRSFLRTVLDNHLMEIYFKGKIPIKPYNGKFKEQYQQWTIA